MIRFSMLPSDTNQRIERVRNTSDSHMADALRMSMCLHGIEWSLVLGI